MTTKAADDFEAIRRRLEELAAEKNLALTGTSVPKADDKQEDSFWTNFGSGVDYCAYGQQLNPNPIPHQNLYQAAANNRLAGIGNGGLGSGLGSLAHPEWPYAGTAHEWRGFVRAAEAKINQMLADNYALQSKPSFLKEYTVKI